MLQDSRSSRQFHASLHCLILLTNFPKLSIPCFSVKVILFQSVLFLQERIHGTPILATVTVSENHHTAPPTSNALVSCNPYSNGYDPNSTGARPLGDALKVSCRREIRTTPQDAPQKIIHKRAQKSSWQLKASSQTHADVSGILFTHSHAWY